MKTFIYTSKKPNNKKLIGKRELNIYRIVRNKPKHVGAVTYHVGLSKGADSEVLNYLIDYKHIPKRFGDINGGYYSPDFEGKGYKIMRVI